MSSIFIWKAEPKADTGYSMVRYDRGADWSLEESGESYQWIRQQKGVDSDSGQTYVYYEAKRMPMDWMGACWLESLVIPYRVWKEEGGSRWDQLGGWNRYVGPNTGHTASDQWEAIQKWCRGETGVPVAPAPAPAPAPVRRAPYERRGGRGGLRPVHQESLCLRPVHRECLDLRPVHQEHPMDNGQGREQGRGRGRGRGRGGRGMDRGRGR